MSGARLPHTPKTRVCYDGKEARPQPTGERDYAESLVTLVVLDCDFSVNLLSRAKPNINTGHWLILMIDDVCRGFIIISSSSLHRTISVITPVAKWTPSV